MNLSIPRCLIRNQRRSTHQLILPEWWQKPLQEIKKQENGRYFSNGVLSLGHELANDHQFSDQRRYLSSGSTKSDNTISNQRPDPLARRPNKVCDPYGQGGMPMSWDVAQRLLSTTLEEGWKLQEEPPSHPNNNDINNDQDAEESNKNHNVPESLYREFYHFDFMQASKFISHMAAIAHNNNHYPSIKLERRLHSKKGAWQVVTTIKCRTPTLQGLSHHDFHIALMVDVEIARPHVQQLLLTNEQSQRKHT